MPRRPHRSGVLVGGRQEQALVDPEVEQHVHAVAVAEVIRHLLRQHVRLGQHHCLASAPLQEAPKVDQVLVLRWPGWQHHFRLVLDHERHGVEAEAAHSELDPEAHDALDLFTYGRVFEVQVWLEVVETVEVVGVRLAVVGPGGFLHAGEGDTALGVLRLVFGPDVPIPIWRIRVRPGGLKPRMLVGRVVDDQVDDYPNAVLVRLVHEVDEVAQ